MQSGAIANSRTLYEAASLTKPLVAEIARRLHKQGVFDLDEKIAETISNDRVVNAQAWKKLTPRDLLSHTSGFPNWSGDSRDPDRGDRLEFAFEPGTRFQYSGEGYGVLLMFLEAKAGRSGIDLAAELFQEIGMSNSTLTGRKFAGHYARGHWRSAPGRQGGRTNEPVAAYSLFTNAHDYGKFLVFVMREHAAGLDGDDPFPATQTKFETARSGELLGWSLGWGTLKRADANIYFQWGDNGAFRSFAAFDPATGNGIAYFTNGSLGTIYADELAAPVLGDVKTASSWFSDPIKELARTWFKF